MNNRYNPRIHNRRSIRLKGYDYSQAGLYFITICVQNRENLFGNITNEIMNRNDAGKMIEKQWIELSKRFKNIILNEFIIMPNHFHAILEIRETPIKGQPQGIAPTETVRATFMVDPIKGQPQEISPTETVRATFMVDPIKGQPQEISPTETVRATFMVDPTKGQSEKGLGEIIGAFKSITTNEYIKGVKSNNWQRFNGKLWQRNYWEHIIRNEKSYQNISEYIVNNPLKWNDDKLNSSK